MFIHKSAECARCTIVPQASLPSSQNPLRSPVIFFLSFFFYEKPRRLDVNTVLMGKRFEEEASLTSALRWADERKQAQKRSAGIQKKLRGISSNETTLASRERRKRQTGYTWKIHAFIVRRVLSWIILKPLGQHYYRLFYLTPLQFERNHIFLIIRRVRLYFRNALTRILNRWMLLSGSGCCIRFDDKQTKYILSTNLIANENRSSAIDYELRMLWISFYLDNSPAKEANMKK